MGKVQVKAKSSRKSRQHKGGSSKKTAAQDLPALLAQAIEFLRIGNPEGALPIAEEALGLCSQPRNTQYSLLALNLVAQIEIELGDPDAAREHFKAAVELDPNGELPEELGGGAEKFFSLAQLSEEGGRDSVQWFKRGAIILEQALRDQSLSKGEVDEKKTKLTSALCGMIEVWMTDLSLEPEAETTCETLITQALMISDPPSPYTLQTLASVRLSQSRFEDAQSALQRSLDSWKDLSPEDPSIPDFPTRISLVRLLMDAELEESALEVVERLVGEDDQSVEAWYLGGWCLWVLGHKGEAVDDEDQKALLLSSREWLRNCLKLYALLDYEDDRLRDHAMELVSGLDEQLAGQEIEDDEDWEDHDSDGSDMISDEDHEMNGA